MENVDGNSLKIGVDASTKLGLTGNASIGEAIDVLLSDPSINGKIGDIRDSLASPLGDGWVLANGAVIDTAKYPDAQAVIDPYDKLTFSQSTGTWNGNYSSGTYPIEMYTNKCIYYNNEWLTIRRYNSTSSSITIDRGSKPGRNDLGSKTIDVTHMYSGPAIGIGLFYFQKKIVFFYTSVYNNAYPNLNGGDRLYYAYADNLDATWKFVAHPFSGTVLQTGSYYTYRLNRVGDDAILFTAAKIDSFYAQLTRNLTSWEDIQSSNHPTKDGTGNAYIFDIVKHNGKYYYFGVYPSYSSNYMRTSTFYLTTDTLLTSGIPYSNRKTITQNPNGNNTAVSPLYAKEMGGLLFFASAGTLSVLIDSSSKIKVLYSSTNYNYFPYHDELLNNIFVLVVGTNNNNYGYQIVRLIQSDTDILPENIINVTSLTDTQVKRLNPSYGGQFSIANRLMTGGLWYDISPRTPKITRDSCYTYIKVGGL